MRVQDGTVKLLLKVCNRTDVFMRNLKEFLSLSVSDRSEREDCKCMKSIVLPLDVWVRRCPVEAKSTHQLDIKYRNVQLCIFSRDHQQSEASKLRCVSPHNSQRPSP